jgi:hypothetical protein
LALNGGLKRHLVQQRPNTPPVAAVVGYRQTLSALGLRHPRRPPCTTDDR